MAVLDAPVIEVYDSSGRMCDWVRAPESVRIVPRWNEPGEATITVQFADPRAKWLREPGARVRILFRGEHLLGGPVMSWSTQGPGKHMSWTFNVTDDSAVLDRILCLPDPTKAFDQQPTTSAQTATMSGKVESVLKKLVVDNSPVNGIPVDVVADQGRGDQVVVVKPRWQSIRDVIDGSLRQSGLGVSVVWRPETGRLLLDVVERHPYPIQLTPESRTITSWSISSQAPVVTRVWLGVADGSVFRREIRADVENQWGPYLCGGTFRPASTAEEAGTAATDAFNDGGPKTGLSVTLSEAGMVRYGGATGLKVGSVATIHIGDVTITDVIREAVIEWSPGKPLTVTPSVGGWDNSPTTVLAQAVRRVAASVSRLYR